MANLRSFLMIGMIILSSALIVAQWFIMRSWPKHRRMLKSLGIIGMTAAGFALAATFIIEARFHWIRHQVLNADPVRLEKLGRHFIVGYNRRHEAMELVKRGAVAGLFVSGSNIHGMSIGEIREQIQSFQDERRRNGLSPLWIATDQEGGIVSRLSPPLTRFPALSEIVQNNPGPERRRQAVEELARSQGRELASLGVNLNLAPVVDVNHQVVNPDDKYSRIYLRAISTDPSITAATALTYCEALEKEGVRCTLKHFPGLGRVFEDTHMVQANLSASIRDLAATDWLPFRSVVGTNQAFIMLGHASLTAVDAEQPASFSHKVVTGILRNEWKYNGILITDNFSMQAVYRSKTGMDQAAVECLNAGVDLILVSYDPDQYYRIMFALLNADENGNPDHEALRRSDVRLSNAVRFIRHYSKCQKFLPKFTENPLFEKSRFSGPFRQKRLTISTTNRFYRINKKPTQVQKTAFHKRQNFWQLL